jgi:hypothetical protein
MFNAILAPVYIALRLLYRCAKLYTLTRLAVISGGLGTLVAFLSVTMIRVDSITP